MEPELNRRALGGEAAAIEFLVLGLGNVLLSDDGIGVHVLRTLGEIDLDGAIGRGIGLRDGGTLGLSLLTEVEQCSALIAIDAAELGEEPGTVRTFSGPDMDRQLSGLKRTAHEVALADLMAAAQLSDRAPERRALVAIQPGSTAWGLSPTESVLAAIPAACEAVLSLLEAWTHDR